jgi:hypothetical protein
MSRFSSLTRRLARASWDVFIVRKRINRLVFFSVWSASTNGLGLAKNHGRATARLGPNVAPPVLWHIHYNAAYIPFSLDCTITQTRAHIRAGARRPTSRYYSDQNVRQTPKKNYAQKTGETQKR